MLNKKVENKDFIVVQTIGDDYYPFIYFESMLVDIRSMKTVKELYISPNLLIIYNDGTSSSLREAGSEYKNNCSDLVKKVIVDEDLLNILVEDGKVSYTANTAELYKLPKKYAIGSDVFYLINGTVKKSLEDKSDVSDDDVVKVLKRYGLDSNMVGTMYISDIIEMLVDEYDEELSPDARNLNDKNNYHFVEANMYFECGLNRLHSEIDRAISNLGIKDFSLFANSIAREIYLSRKSNEYSKEDIRLLSKQIKEVC